MVNKKGTRLLKVIALIIFIFFNIQILWTQDISKYYKTSVQQNGILYYILPQKGFENEKANAKLNYDVTYISEKDSVTFNFSYFDNSVFIVDSILFENTLIKYSTSTEKIYIENKKNIWEHRYSSKVLFENLEQLYVNENDVPVLILYSRNSSPIVLNIKKNKWKRQAAIIAKIIETIKYNKN